MTEIILLMLMIMVVGTIHQVLTQDVSFALLTIGLIIALGFLEIQIDKRDG